MYLLKNYWAVKALGIENANILHMLALLGHVDISNLQPKMRKVLLCKPLPCMFFQCVTFRLHSDKATARKMHIRHLPLSNCYHPMGASLPKGGPMPMTLGIFKRRL